MRYCKILVKEIGEFDCSKRKNFLVAGRRLTAGAAKIGATDWSQESFFIHLLYWWPEPRPYCEIWRDMRDMRDMAGYGGIREILLRYSQILSINPRG